jgi:hypothetical protein
MAVAYLTLRGLHLGISFLREERTKGVANFRRVWCKGSSPCAPSTWSICSVGLVTNLHPGYSKLLEYMHAWSMKMILAVKLHNNNHIKPDFCWRVWLLTLVLNEHNKKSNQHSNSPSKSVKYPWNCTQLNITAFIV